MFPGWHMVGVAFTAHLVSSGLGFYALSRLLPPLADAYTEGALTGVALLQTATSAAGFIVGPLVGRATAHYPLHRIMSAGALVLAAGFFLAAFASTLWQLVLIYAVAVPVAIGTLSGIGANLLVSNWFDRKRALALGIAQVGVSLPGVFIGFLVSYTLELGGLQATFLCFALIALLLWPLLHFCVVAHPSQRGLGPDGGPPHTADAHGTRDMKPAEVFRNRNFLLVGVSAGLCFAGATGMIQHSINMARVAGHSEASANALLSLMAVGAALGKPGFGALTQMIGERAAYLTAIANQGITLLLIAATQANFPLLAGSALIFGLSFGGILPLLGALLARIFGAERFGPAMGYVGPVLIPFQMGGIPFAAWVWDTWGSYTPAIYTFIGTTALALLLTLFLRLPPQPPGTDDDAAPSGDAAPAPAA